MAGHASPNDPLQEHYDIPSTRDEAARVAQRIHDALKHRGCDEATCFAIRLAVDEALTNAIIHGNEGDPERRVNVRLDADDRAVEIEITDEGGGFDPQAVPDPTQDENLQIPAGRGIMLMRAYMTDVEFVPPCNRVRMRYRFSRSDDQRQGAVR